MPQLNMLDVNDRVSNNTNIYIKSNILACKNAKKKNQDAGSILHTVESKAH